MNVYQKLLEVQTRLKAPKSQFNSFGKYNYRSTEDILEGLKPLLKEVGATVTIEDEIKLIGDRYYIDLHSTLVLLKEVLFSSDSFNMCPLIIYILL